MQYLVLTRVNILLLSTFLLGMPSAHACVMTFELEQAITEFNWEDLEIQQRVGVRKQSGECEDYFITFESYRGLSNHRYLQAYSSSTRLDYSIETNEGRREAFKGIQNFAFLNTRFNSGAVRATHLFTLSLLNFDVEALYRAGSYEDEIKITLYSGTTLSPTMQDTKSFQVLKSVSERLDIALVNTGEDFRHGATTYHLSFGELEKSKTRDLDVLVVSNTAYHVRISSLNNWHLVHESNLSNIAYQLFEKYGYSNSGGNSILLTGQSDFSGNRGDRYRLELQIGSVEQKIAGEYSDSILLEVVSGY